MGKIVFKTECLAPNRHLTLNYKGLNPFQAYNATPGFLKKIWEVESKDYWERDFRYDATGDPRTFYLRAFVERGIDKYTKALIEVILEGKQPVDPNKPGTVEIKMGGDLTTSFGGGNFFSDSKNPIYKGLINLYMRTFYKKVRESYLDEFCKRRLHTMKAMMQEVMGISPSE